MVKDLHNAILAFDFRVDAISAGTSAVSCSVRAQGLPERLVFEVPATSAGAVDLDEPNWAALALLYPAMFLGRALLIDAALSPRLLHALRTDIQALLQTLDGRLKTVEISARATDAAKILAPARGVATGFSAGVDSFASVMAYSRADTPPALKLTHLTVFNVGAFGGSKAADRLFAHAVARCRDFAASQGFGAYSVNSNLDDFYPKGLIETRFANSHTLRNAAAAFLLQKALGGYVYSSTFPYARLGLSRSGDTASIDPILLPLLSTERMTFVSGCASLSRPEKTALVAKSPEARSLLDVCIVSRTERLEGAKINCSRCRKCLRTILTLEALGELDNFEAAFDVGYYRSDKTRLIRQLMARSRSAADIGAREAIDFARSHGLPLPRDLGRLNGPAILLSHLAAGRVPSSPGQMLHALSSLRRRLFS